MFILLWLENLIIRSSTLNKEKPHQLLIYETQLKNKTLSSFNISGSELLCGSFIFVLMSNYTVMAEN